MNEANREEGDPILFDSIYMKLEKKKNKCMVKEVRIVVASWVGVEWERELLEMFTIFICEGTTLLHIC